MQPVEVKEIGPGGRVTARVDPCGAVFRGVKGAMRPVYLIGGKPDKGSRQEQHAMFTCPVSAIPAELFDLLDTWQACRLMSALPRAGGLLDQSEIVQLAFPIFESLARREERKHEQHAPAATAAMVLAAAFGKKTTR